MEGLKENAEIDNHLFIVGSWWFPICVYSYADKGNLNTIGIVKVKDKLTKEEKYYIGVGKGQNIKFDEELIAKGGAPFHPCIFERI